MSRLSIIATMLAMLAGCATSTDNADRKDQKTVVVFIEAMEPTDTTMEWRPQDTIVKPGDVIEWHVRRGTHGVTFKDWTFASKYLKVDTKASMKIGAQPGFDDPAQGTEAVSANGDQSRLLVRATVQAIPEDKRDIEFVCTKHRDKMSGKVTFRSDGSNRPK